MKLKINKKFIKKIRNQKNKNQIKKEKYHKFELKDKIEDI